MKLKTVSGIVLTLLLVGTLALAFDVQPVKASGTIYIRADGSIYPPTSNITSTDNVTYYFTDNNHDSIIVERDNITVDGAGYTLEGPADPWGIYLIQRQNVTIKNMEIKAFVIGIYATDSSNIILSSNSITSNEYGILLRSRGSVFRDNEISKNGCNLQIAGGNLSFYAHDIDTSNKVDGKPIYYLVNQHNKQIPANAGFVGVINSTNIVVKNLTIIKNGQGILLAYTNSSIVENVTVTKNDCNIWIQSSHDNTIKDNIVTHSDACMHGSILGWPVGILILSSDRNNITANMMANNKDGISLIASNDNIVKGNMIKDSFHYGIILQSSGMHACGNNTIYHNNFINNTVQVGDIGYIKGANTWDNGYPSGGNYWSDHNPPDLYEGPYQNETGSDGIGDTAYIIDGNNTDRYPLIYPYGHYPTIDVNGDGVIDIVDIVILVLRFGSKPGEPIWDPWVDLNQDGIIDIIDLVMVAIHFGETW